MGEWMFRLVASVLGVVVAALVLAGCGGGPDVAGRWEGEVKPEGEPPGQFALDLEENGGEDFRGTLTIFSESGDAQGPVSGELDDDGAFRLEPGGGIVIDGRLEGDSMSGTWFSDGVSPPFSAERVSEEEAQRRSEERTAEYRAAEREEELAQRVSEMDARVSEIIEEPPSDEDSSALEPDSVGPPTVGYSAGDRLEFLESAGDTLLAAVGDPECEEGTYCDVLQGRQAQLEDDRPALQEYAVEERAGEYHLCDQAINVSYWEADATDGAEARYRETRRMVETVRESLPGRYEEALGLTREAERMAQPLPEDERPSMSYPASELEDLHGRATQAAGESAEEALTQAGTRKEEYERQIAQVTDEALALYEEAGCRE